MKYLIKPNLTFYKISFIFFFFFLFYILQIFNFNISIIKSVFIIFLFILNMYLIFSENTNEKQVLESGIGNNLIKNGMAALLGTCTLYSTYLAHNAEKINKIKHKEDLDKLKIMWAKEKVENSDKIIELTKEKVSLVSKIAEYKDQISGVRESLEKAQKYLEESEDKNTQMELAKTELCSAFRKTHQWFITNNIPIAEEYKNYILTTSNSVKLDNQPETSTLTTVENQPNIISTPTSTSTPNITSTSSTTNLPLILQRQKENQPVTVSTGLEKSVETPLTTVENLATSTGLEKPTITPLTTDEIKKSSVLNNLWERFETLDTLEKFAISIILLKSVLITALISIVFIFYGDYLIKKYNLELRYPKIANIIHLRRKFSRYYLILNICLIIYVISIEIIFSILLLT